MLILYLFVCVMILLFFFFKLSFNRQRSWYNIGYTACGDLSHEQDLGLEHMLLLPYAFKFKDKVEKQSISPIETNVLMVKAIVSKGELKWKRTNK